MYQLHHCVGARSFRVLWTLEELGLPCELKLWPFPPRMKAREYLEINPLGTIPAFFDGDTAMTESVAICQYLVARHGNGPLGVAPDEADFGAFLNALHFSEATLTFPQTLVLRYGWLEPEERRLPGVAADYRKWFLARLKAVEARLDGREWLCAGRFTIADVAVGYALMLADYIGMSEEFPPRVAAYWQRLKQREACIRALAIERKTAAAQGISPEPLGGFVT